MFSVQSLEKVKPFLYTGIAGMIAAEPAHAGLLTINYTFPIIWILVAATFLFYEKTWFNPVLAELAEEDMYVRRKIAEREAEIAAAEAEY